MKTVPLYWVDGRGVVVSLWPACDVVLKKSGDSVTITLTFTGW